MTLGWLFYGHHDIIKTAQAGVKSAPAEMVMRDTRDYENILTAINRKKTTPPQTDLSGQ